jgi:hypothetical protein
MTIQKKDNLHNLIKSLTKNEKKYFRDFLKKGKESKLYLLLFNKIEKQSKHEKEEIKKSFDNKANQLPVIKTYLTKNIQKVLNFYHRDSDNFNLIHNIFLDVNLLLQRELFDLAESEIEKALQLSETSELPFELLRALEFQKQFLIKKYGATSEEIKKPLITIIERQNELLSQIFNLNELQQLQATFYEHFQESAGLNPVIYTTLNKNPLLADEKKALSLAAKLLQADLLYRTHIFKDKNFPAADAAVQKALRQMEMSPRAIQGQPEIYLSLLNQRLQLLIYQKKLPEIQNLLGLIRQAPATFHFDIKNPTLRRYLMEASALELSIYRQTKEHAKAELLIKNLTGQYKDLNSPLLRQWKTVMDYEIAKYYFDRQQYGQALQKIREIGKGEYSLREGIILLRSYFLRAQIALTEKNNLELNKVSSLIKNFFKTVKNPTRLEKNLLHFLEMWPSCQNSLSKRKKLDLQVQKVRKAINRNSPAELEELADWLEKFLSAA